MKDYAIASVEYDASGNRWVVVHYLEQGEFEVSFSSEYEAEQFAKELNEDA